jgi:hypothetical protein
MMMSINNNGVDVYTPKPSATPYNRGVPPSAQQDTYGAPQRPLTPLGQSVFAPDASTASIISRLSAQVQSIQAQLDGIQAQQLQTQQRVIFTQQQTVNPFAFLGQGAIGQAFSSFFGNLRRFILGGKDQTDDEEIDIERERFEQKDARELFAKDRVAKPAGTELK